MMSDVRSEMAALQVTMEARRKVRDALDAFIADPDTREYLERALANLNEDVAKGEVEVNAAMLRRELEAWAT